MPRRLEYVYPHRRRDADRLPWRRLGFRHAIPSASGSDTVTLSELRTVDVNAVNQVQGGENAYSFHETENDSWTSSSWAESTGVSLRSSGTESLTSTSSLTDAGSLANILTMTATDTLAYGGGISREAVASRSIPPPRTRRPSTPTTPTRSRSWRQRQLRLRHGDRDQP